MAIICRDIKLLFIQVPGTGCSSVSEVLVKKLGGEEIPKDDILLGNRYKLVGSKHNTVNQLLGFNLISHQEFKSFLKFATVRNPFDRFATEHQRLIGPWWEKMITSDDPNCPANRSGKAHRERYVNKFSREIQLAREESFEKWLWRQIILPQRFDERIKNSWKSIFNQKALLISQEALKREIAYPMLENIDQVIHYENIEKDFNQILEKVGVKEYIPVPHTNKTPGKKSYQEYYSPKARSILEEELGRELALFGYTFGSASENSNLALVSQASKELIS